MVARHAPLHRDAWCFLLRFWAQSANVAFLCTDETSPECIFRNSRGLKGGQACKLVSLTTPLRISLSRPSQCCCHAAKAEGGSLVQRRATQPCTIGLCTDGKVLVLRSRRRALCL